MHRRVVLTGAGVITPFGVGLEATYAGLVAGRSLARTISGFDTRGLEVRIGCELPPSLDLDALAGGDKSVKTMAASTKLAVACGRLAMQHAGLEMNDVAPERLGISLGISGMQPTDADFAVAQARALEKGAKEDSAQTPGLIARAKHRHLNPVWLLRLFPNFVATHLAVTFAARGPCMTLATSCTSSTQALGEALHWLRTGRADVVLAGGADANVGPESLMLFNKLGVLSRANDDPERASRPFALDREGFVMGDGGAVYVLETLEHARARDASILAELTGYGLAQDAYRLTDEAPDACGSIAALRGALADAHLAPSDLGYIAAHGTGTKMNDVLESRAMREVFGPAGTAPPASAVKSMLGHTLAASGAVELTACLMALERGVLAPTVNLRERDPDCDLDYVANEPRAATVRHVLKSSFGFGGQNACLVLSAWDRGSAA